MSTSLFDQASRGRLFTLDEACEILSPGRPAAVAADKALLQKLPKGCWIGGSIPYFMAQDGGQVCQDRVFVQLMPEEVLSVRIQSYGLDEIHRIAVDGPEQGFSVLLIPHNTEVHHAYARNAPNYEQMYMKPIIGWITGCHLDELATGKSGVLNGETGQLVEEAALAMHIDLPANCIAEIGIVNIFEQGSGPVFHFPQAGMHVDDCRIDGVEGRLADYVIDNNIDIQLPLVADCYGVMVNVSIAAVDQEKRTVDLYAPVFPDTEYRFADPVGDYVSGFQKALPELPGGSQFSCNCILNYLYSELEGKKTEEITGPMTFGEIGYQLLNQTLVYMTIHRL